MRPEQRFFEQFTDFLVVLAVVVFLSESATEAAERILLDEGRVSLILPDGWELIPSLVAKE